MSADALAAARPASRHASGASASSGTVLAWHQVRSVFDERITVVVLAESVEGSLVMIVSPASSNATLGGAYGAFTVTAWLEDEETVRMSLRSSSSDAIAYLQGGNALIAFARELGLAAAP
jgi:hypothetical protein